MDKVINQVLYACLDEIKKPATNELLKNDFMNPIVAYIGQQIWPYIIVTSILFIIMCVVLFAIMYIIYKQHSYQIQHIT
jgi:hypothetical protein